MRDGGAPWLRWSFLSLASGDPILYRINQRGLLNCSEMPQLSHFEDRRRHGWCAVVVLVAVCSLIVSVATRYSSTGDPSSTTVKAFRTHALPEAKRQRLAKDAADWMPPVICFSLLQSPPSYPRIAPAGPPLPERLFEESLYNRPPPSYESLS